MRCVRFVAVGLALALVAVWGSATAQVKDGKMADAGPKDVGGKGMDAWIKEISDPDPSVREQAIKVIPVFGAAAKKAVPELLKQLGASDLSPQANAAIALGQIPITDDPKMVNDVVEGLLRLINSPQAIVRLQATVSIGRQGSLGRRAVSRIVPLMKDRSSWEIRRAAAEALGRIGYMEDNSPDVRALIALIEGIDDVSREVRVDSLQGLIYLGPPSNPSDIAEIKRRLEQRVKSDKDKQAGIWLRVALMRVDAASMTPKNLDFIADLTKNTDPVLAFNAVKALGVIGEAAKGKIGDLIAALKHDDLNVVATAIWSITRMGRTAEGAVTRLKELETHKEEAIREAAKDAIKMIQTPPKK